MNQIIRNAAHIIGKDSRSYPEGYVIRYKLEAIVCKVQSLSAHRQKLIPCSTQSLIGDAQATFAHSFGRWLNKFGVSKSSEGSDRGDA